MNADGRINNETNNKRSRPSGADRGGQETARKPKDRAEEAQGLNEVPQQVKNGRGKKMRIIIAFIIGAFTGIMIAALMVVAGKDRRE